MKKNLIEYFEDTAFRYSNKVAVIDRERSITFSELREKSLVLASAIKAKNSPVAIYLNKSIESVFADLGVIYSRNFYMNLDVKNTFRAYKEYHRSDMSIYYRYQ